MRVLGESALERARVNTHTPVHTPTFTHTQRAVGSARVNAIESARSGSARVSAVGSARSGSVRVSAIDNARSKCSWKYSLP